MHLALHDAPQEPCWPARAVDPAHNLSCLCFGLRLCMPFSGRDAIELPSTNSHTYIMLISFLHGYKVSNK